MASRIGPRAARSVKDATRFTSTIPHATSKMASSMPVSPNVVGAAASAAAATTPARSSRMPGETPEQRIKRLRAAHLAARQIPLSRMDRFIDWSRPICDWMHRFVVKCLVSFTIILTFVCIYSVWDMLRFNRRRRAEWVETLKRLDTDDLARARLAYLKDEATEEQIALVEHANSEAEKRGYRLPPMIEPPQQATHFEEHIKPVFQRSNGGSTAPATGKGILGVITGLFGSGGGGDGSGSESQLAVDDAAVAAVEGAGGDVGSRAEGVEDNTVRAAARGVWEKEKENQRKGGSLDRLGLEGASEDQTATKKGWWPW